jgi:N-acyl-D-aspartate/D-glutamate deacylase
VLTLEHGVHKLTGQLAAAFGIAGRGVLRAGYSADVTVFDPGTVAPGPLRRVWDFPGGSDRLVADRPTGILHVVVNGTVIREDEQPARTNGGRYPGVLVAPGTVP